MSKTILLVRGAWGTTSCRTNFRNLLEARGHEVVVPACRYMEKRVEELRRHPSHIWENRPSKALRTISKRRFARYRPLPSLGRIYLQAELGIGDSVKFKNPKRPPLLLIVAHQDRTSTTSVVRVMYRKYRRAPSRTDVIESPARSHGLLANLARTK